jgi:hypothetical protein
MGHDLNTVYECEKLILNKMTWKVNLSSAFEQQRLIIDKYTIEAELSDGISFDSIAETSNDWVSFCLNEFSIFSKYDQYNLALGCVLITYKYNMMNSSLEALKGLLPPDQNSYIGELIQTIISLLKEEPDEENIGSTYYDNNSTTFNSERRISTDFEEFKSCTNVIRSPFKEITNNLSNTFRNEFLGKKQKRKRVKCIKKQNK